jgi:hemolysin activation/secretion protein
MKRLHTPCLIAIAFFFSLSCSAVFAADIDILDKQRKEAPVPKSRSPLEIVDDKARDGTDKSVRFILGGLRVEGATVFTAEELTAPYQSRYGAEISFEEARRIADAMTKKYRDAGYLLSRVVLPAEQGTVDAKNAQLRLQALEGYIAAIEYQGEAELVAQFKSWWGVIEQRLLAKRPLKHADFEREMLLLQDLPGIGVSSSFNPAAETSGAAVLVLELKRKRLDASVSGGNTGTKSAGRGILTVNLGLAAWPLIGGHTTLSYTQATHRREYASLQLAHAHRFVNGLIVNASVARSLSPEPDSDFARAFDYETESQTFSTGFSYPVIRGRDMNLNAGLGYEHRNSEADLAQAPYTRDRLRNLSVNVDFDFSDEWGGVTQLTASLTRGLDWFDATDRDDRASTPIAPAHFTRHILYLSRNQALPGNFSAFAAAEAQFSNAPLSSYNRYTLGGSQFGRGYDSGVSENDNGLAASLEGRWNGNLANLSLQPFVFIDWGKTWAETRVAGSRNAEYIASTGIGVRLGGKLPGATAGQFNLTFFAGKPLRAIGDIHTSDERYMLQGVFSF